MSRSTRLGRRPESWQPHQLAASTLSRAHSAEGGIVSYWQIQALSLRDCELLGARNTTARVAKRAAGTSRERLVAR
jgi:hypothetical protein